jgi:hypothetical protein
MTSPTEPIQNLTRRRWISRLIRVSLIVLAIAVVGTWIGRRAPDPRRMQVQGEVPPPESLGLGDLRIFNRDSVVQVMLVGDRVLAGLSPMTVGRVRSELQARGPEESSGLGGRIAATVKSTVADNIGLHVVYPVRDIQDIRYVNGRIVIDQNGRATSLFRNVKVDGSRETSSFREEDAQRFIEAVRARREQLQP